MKSNVLIYIHVPRPSAGPSERAVYFGVRQLEGARSSTDGHGAGGNICWGAQCDGTDGEFRPYRVGEDGGVGAGSGAGAGNCSDLALQRRMFKVIILHSVLWLQRLSHSVRSESDGVLLADCSEIRHDCCLDPSVLPVPSLALISSLTYQRQPVRRRRPAAKRTAQHSTAHDTGHTAPYALCQYGM